MTARRHDALLAEDVIVPMHHHEPDQDYLLSMAGGEPRVVTPEEADVIASECSLVRSHDDPSVEIADDGPRGLKTRVGRRSILRGGAALGLGSLLAAASVPRFAFAAEARRDVLVVIFLRGGMDGLSAVVPVNDSAYYKARPTLGVSAQNTLPLTANYGLNKTMAALKPMWDAKQLGIAIGSGHPALTRSHFTDMASVERSAPAQVRSGWLGRHLASVSSSTGTFRAITMGNSVSTSLMTNAVEALAMTDISAFKVEGWEGYREQTMRTLDALYGQTGGEVNETADSTFGAIAGLAGLRGTAYSPANGAVYPEGAFGNGMRDTARLIKAGKGLEVACVDLGDWDHHTDLKTQFDSLSSLLARGLAAFRTDLGADWNRVTVVTMSEFGRRVAENGGKGTDHGHAGVMFFAGGNVRGGIYGTQPALTSGNLTQGDVPITSDYRAGLSEMVSKRLGNAANLSTVFPDYKPQPLGVF